MDFTVRRMTENYGDVIGTNFGDYGKTWDAEDVCIIGKDGDPTLRYDPLIERVVKVTSENKMVTTELCEYYADKGRYYNRDGELYCDKSQMRGRCRKCHGRGTQVFDDSRGNYRIVACGCVQRSMARHAGIKFSIDDIVLGQFE
jgi:hypothetical protein